MQPLGDAPSVAAKPDLPWETILVVVLRAAAVLLLSALVPAVMPFAWMDAIHRLLGMGELPRGPIMDYLTRSLSAIYALHGGLVLFVSWDVRRHLPVIRCLAVLGILFGAGIFVLDLLAGMPPWWTICEGPFILVLSGLLLGLVGRTERQIAT